jgi:hypothetical protein
MLLYNYSRNIIYATIESGDDHIFCWFCSKRIECDIFGYRSCRVIGEEYNEIKNK